MCPARPQSAQRRHGRRLAGPGGRPLIIRHTDGLYYFTATVPEYDRIILRRSRTLNGLATAAESVIWRAHATGPMGAHSSTDLKNCEFRAHVLSQSSATELSTAYIERPKVIYNASTGTFVMWMHKKNGVDCTQARAAVAVSSTVDGSDTYQGGFQPLGQYQPHDMTTFSTPTAPPTWSTTRGPARTPGGGSAPPWRRTSGLAPARGAPSDGQNGFRPAGRWRRSPCPR